MHNEPSLKSLTIVLDDQFGKMVDNYGNVMCEADPDDRPVEVMIKVAKAVCKTAGFKFEVK